MSYFEKSLFFHETCSAVKRQKDHIEYVIQCVDGTGTMSCYEFNPDEKTAYHSHQRARRTDAEPMK